MYDGWSHVYVDHNLFQMVDVDRPGGALGNSVADVVESRKPHGRPEIGYVSLHPLTLLLLRMLRLLRLLLLLLLGPPPERRHGVWLSVGMRVRRSPRDLQDRADRQAVVRDREPVLQEVPRGIIPADLVVV